MPVNKLTISIAAVLAAMLVAGPAGSQRTARTGAVSGRVTIMAHGKPVADRAGVVVAIEDVPGDVVEPMHVDMRQRKRAFVPDHMVVTRGSTVGFPNDDRIFHNVFSLSRAARFDLGLYKSGTSKTVTLRRAGVVDVHCNIHPEMVATIKVLDTSYYALTGRDGTFRIDKLIPGTYSMEAWLPHGTSYRGQITVTPGKTATVDITVERGRAPRRHLRKDGTPYGRYR